MADDERDWGKIGMGFALIVLIAWIGTAGFTNWTFGGLLEPTDGDDDAQPGVQTKSTIVFYNGTAANDGTIQLVSMDGIPTASGAVSAGTGTTGTLLPGTYYRYISGVTGAAVYIDTIEVPKIPDVAQTYATLDPVQLYRNSTTYSVMTSGAGSAYTRANSDVAQTNKNFTMSAQSEEPFVVTMTEKMGYAQFLEAYRDPVSGVSCEPLVWIEVTSTNIYSMTDAVQSWADSTKSYFLLPLSAVLNPSKGSTIGTATFALTAPSAGDFAYTMYLVTYSDVATLLKAKTRVANAAGPFTVDSWIMCSGHLEVS